MSRVRSIYCLASPVFLAAIVMLSGAAARAAGVTTVAAASVRQQADITRFSLTLDEPAPFTLFMLPDPWRVVIDMSELGWAKGSAAAPTGLVRQVRHAVFKPGSTRIVLDLAGPAQLARAEIVPGEGGYRLEVDLRPTSDKAFLAASQKPLASSGGRVAAPSAPAEAGPAEVRAAEAKPAPEPKADMAPALVEKPAEKAIEKLAEKTAEGIKPRPPASARGKSGVRTIVIDPGHGGVDPGAIAYNGIFEKNITLAIGREVRRALQQNPNYRVVMTRADDVFIPLGERVNIARKAKADMFVSIHADMLQDRSVRGATVYTLSDKASDKEAEQLAAKENKADIIGGIDLGAASADVTTILIDLAQRETMAYSTQLAGLVVPSLETTARLSTHGVRSAGFRVLKAPDVPSILIETGYLSNASDVAFLTGRDGQRRIADAVRRAVDSYFSAHAARAD